MIVTVTLNPAVDKSCSVEQVVPERKLYCDEPIFHPGGGGINVARAVHVLGGDVLALWTCGGAVGQLLQSALDEDGVPHQPLVIEDMTRENLVVYEESSGQQFRFGMPGARMTPSEIEECVQRVRNLDPTPQYLVLSGSLPPHSDDALYARIGQALPASCRIVVDARGKSLEAALESGVYMIKPNLRELALIAGREITKDAHITEICQRLIGEGKVEVIVVSLGSGGVQLFTKDTHQQIHAPTVKIRSKVGAGDSMVAGIVVTLCRGKPISDAVRYGVAAGSAAVMTKGTELCRKTDVERLYKEMTEL